MKNNIKDIIKEKEKTKTVSLGMTLSRNILKQLDEEMKRLDIKSRSFLIEMILIHYFSLEITEDKKEEDIKKA